MADKLSKFYENLNRYCETNEWVIQTIVPDDFPIESLYLDLLKYLILTKNHCLEIIMKGYNEKSFHECIEYIKGLPDEYERYILSLIEGYLNDNYNTIFTIFKLIYIIELEAKHVKNVIKENNPYLFEDD